jgi:hypothetical protein
MSCNLDNFSESIMLCTEEEKKESDSGAAAQEDFIIDAEKLARRQKQIDYGKNTLAYQRYLEQIPRYGLFFVSRQSPCQALS